MKTCLTLGLFFAATVLNAQNDLTSAMTQRYFPAIRKNLEASAEVMPAEKYGYRLTPGQMTFGQWLIHSIERNYNDCATLKGEAAPEAQKQAASLKEKAEIVSALKDSFDYCESALAGMNDQKITSSTQLSYAFMHIAIHNNEIYGNIVGYMRMSGIVPPSTAARLSRELKNK